MSTWEEHKRLADRSTIPDRDGYESAAMYAQDQRDAQEARAQWDAGVDPERLNQWKDAARANARYFGTLLGIQWPDAPQEGTKP